MAQDMASTPVPPSRSALDRRGFLAGAAALAVGVGLAGCGDADDPETGGDPGTGGNVSGEPEAPTGGATLPERIGYGDHDEAFGDLRVPVAGQAPFPVVVLIHGGFWRQEFGLDLMDDLGADLASRGVASWNIEYRRVGGRGGWPQTFDDVALAVDHLAAIDGERPGVIDLDRIAVAGHSAGGHLAAWVAGRGRIPVGQPGAGPVVEPVVAFPLAGVLDLAAAARNNVGGSAVPDLIGGSPDEVEARYAVASPVSMLPIGVSVIAIHGDADTIVPPWQSEEYVAAAVGSGDPAEFVLIGGADHFAMIDPTTSSWAAVTGRLPDFF